MQITITVEDPQEYTFDNYADAQAKLAELAGPTPAAPEPVAPVEPAAPVDPAVQPSWPGQ